MRTRRLKNLQFTSASMNENKKRVTLSVHNLCTVFNWDKGSFAKGKKFVLKIEGVESLWYVNRDKKTLTTKGFPSRLERPSTGNPKTYRVSTNIEAL